MTDGKDSHIDIFLRVRPVAKQSGNLNLECSEGKVAFNLPRSYTQGYINNQRERYEFKFNGILTAEAKQDEVFERVARNVVTGALEGYNGTVFAYGQTGSGKTFTITGGPERYVDRGIIPRALSLIYSQVVQRSDQQFAVHISYLEIYNETGYDLLDPHREVQVLEDLPKVSIMEDEEQRIHMRNLSVHRANSEEEALNLLFLGDTNRTISETPMNMASSRSHCVFIVHVEARQPGEERVRRSKLNLVDLAGSERVSKTGLDGGVLKEAKYINLSLHYLEQVIIALQERSMGQARPHVPYRNSMMTTVLRDSLGGNCRTVMVANMTGAQEQLDESISTCRFAQRVAMVSNLVAVNEEDDPALIIQRLKQEVQELKDEIRLLRGAGEARGPLTPDELERLEAQVDEWLADGSPGAALSLGGSMLLIKPALEMLKRRARHGGALQNGKAAGALGSGSSADPEQLQRLKLQVQQRDNEINILVSMLRKRQAAGTQPYGSAAPSAMPPALVSASQLGTSLQPARSPSEPGSSSATERVDAQVSTSGSSAGPLSSNSILADRAKAFELFRKSYRKNEAIEENKALLKTKYQAAKELGQQVSSCKQHIAELKAFIEQRRVQRSMASQSPGVDEQPLAPDAEEGRAKAEIEQEKTMYKQAFNGLRELKHEIEHLQMLLEQSRTKLQRDFEQWLQLMLRQQQPASAVTAQALAAPQQPAIPGTTAAMPATAMQPHVATAARSPPMPQVAAELYKGVSPDVIAAAKPLLTGIPAADADIIKFYEARAKFMQSQLNKPAPAQMA